MADDPFTILRRQFIAIATDEFDDPAFARLTGVPDEVATFDRWLCDAGLGDRQFAPRYPVLRHSPKRRKIERALRDRPPEERFRESDAIVLYITGHGRDKDNRHWLVLKKTELSRIRSTALPTEELIGWLSETGLQHLLVVVDVCHAGQAAVSTLQFEGGLPRGWIGVLTTSPSEKASVAAFSEAVQAYLDSLTANEKLGSNLERYILAEEMLGFANTWLEERGQSIHMMGRCASGRSPCLPNPLYRPELDARVATSESRQDMAIRRGDLAAHWDPRSRGLESSEEAGWYFSGRRNLMIRLIAFTQGAAGTLVVSGPAGSGKSAALSRLVTLSDARFLRENHRFLADLPTELRPPPGAVDVAVLATGKDGSEVIRQVCSALGVKGRPEAAGSPVEPWLEDLHTWLARRERPITVVVDALDEADDPFGLLQGVLRRLEPPHGEPRVRLILGVRSPGWAAPTGVWPTPDFGPGGRPSLGDDAVRSLRAEEVRVDLAPYWESPDLAGYVAELLTVPPGTNGTTPFTGHPLLAARVAERVAAEVGTSYLAARIVARGLATNEQVLDLDDRSWRALAGSGVRGAFSQEIERSLPIVEDRIRALTLLRAIAFGFGRGVPWRDIWPRMATAVAGGSPEYTDADVEWLLQQPVSGYLVRDLEDDVTVYRLCHRSLAEALRSDWYRYLGYPDGEGSRP